MDLLIDTHLHSGQAISHHVLYQDRVQMYCRAGHPALDGPQDETTLAEYEFALLLPACSLSEAQLLAEKLRSTVAA